MNCTSFTRTVYQLIFIECKRNQYKTHSISQENSWNPVGFNIYLSNRPVPYLSELQRNISDELYYHRLGALFTSILHNHSYSSLACCISRIMQCSLRHGTILSHRPSTSAPQHLRRLNQADLSRRLRNTYLLTKMALDFSLKGIVYSFGWSTVVYEVIRFLMLKSRH